MNIIYREKPEKEPFIELGDILEHGNGQSYIVIREESGNITAKNTQGTGSCVGGFGNIDKFNEYCKVIDLHSRVTVYSHKTHELQVIKKA